MKLHKLPLVLGLASASVAYGQFTPIPLNPSSFNQDVVVEAGAQPALLPVTTASIDGGTNNTGSTWYEIGYNPNAPDSGVPAAGTTWNSVSNPANSYKMAPSYVGANNGVLINTVVTNATLTLTAPAAYTALSFIGSGGNGGGVINVTVHYSDGTTEEGTFNNPDWFGGANPAWIAYGRVNAQTFAFDTQGSITDPGNPRWYAREITLTKPTVPVASIDLKYGSGGANVHNGIFAVSGATTAGGAFSPITVTGYNYDFIVEASAGTTAPLNATTASMDSGINNTGSSWYEQGYHPQFPTTGIPAAGSTVTSASAADHSFIMPPSYAANNAVFLDPGAPTGTITLAAPRAVSALSFLAGAGNGPSSIDLTINHADGTTQTTTISVPDWFNAANPVFTANGRVAVDVGTFNTVNGNNPRAYAVDVPISNTTSPVASIDLSFTSTGGRAAIFAVSGSSGAILPIFTTNPGSVLANAGDNVTFTVVANGTAPITYQWQKNVNGTFTDVANGGNISGATTATLSINSVTVANDGQYRVVASNSAGSVNSAAAVLTVLSPLLDVTVPGDPVTGFGGNFPAGEPPANTINDDTTKYLNFGANGGAPFVGPVGLVVSPAAGRTIVSGLRFYTANDASDRDPMDYRLEGSNDGGNSYVLISEGPLAFPEGRNAAGLPLDPMTQVIQQVLFSNTSGYATYRLSFNNVRANATAVAMQVGEVEFLGVADTSGAPSISSPTPAVASAFQGGTATFNVAATGAPAPALRWQRLVGADYVNLADGANVSGSGSSTLTLNNLALADAGSFRVVASGASGSLTSAPVSLRILSSLMDVTTPADTITGFGDTTIGAPNGPGATEPYFAIDDGYSKYLNGGSGFNALAGFAPFGGPVGLVIAPAVGATTVQGLRIYTAEANAERDPADYKLEGSNDGSTYTLISEGPLSLPGTRNAVADVLDPLAGGMQEILFPNARTFTSYRLTFANTKNNATANSLQIGELELLGVVGGSNTPQLSIARNANGTITISTSVNGTLQSATALSDATQWAAEGPITGSVTVTPDAATPAKFYRVVVP